MSRERRVILIMWLVLLAQGIVMALIQPVWSRVDEAQHFHYVQYVAQNRALPVEGQTFVSPEVVDASVKANQWGWRPVGTLSTPVYLDPSSWQTVPPGLDDQEREKWVRRNLWRFSYESMQPPLYYIVNAPLYAALPGDSLVRLYGMRLLAALMASAMVPLTWLTAREAFPGNRLVVFGAPVAILLTQGYALNMSQVTNDVLAVPLAAGAVLLLLRMVGRGLDWKRSLVVGVVIGAALLTKLTTVFLLPVTLAALALPVFYRREKAGRAGAHAGIIFGAAAVMIAPWLAHNFSVYGDATGASAARPLMSSFFISPLVSISSLRLEELLPTFWFGEPIFPFAFWTYAWVAVGTAMVVAILGILFYYFRPEGGEVNDVGINADVAAGGGGSGQAPDVRVRVNFVVVAFVIGVAFNLLIPFGSGIGGVPGRYLYPLLPVGAALLLFGIDRLLGRERARFTTEVLLVWMVVWESLNFLAYIQNR
jgi:4-amino-4-deoxy-L-arabinose transferase-like glycosyltransferase